MRSTGAAQLLLVFQVGSSQSNVNMTKYGDANLWTELPVQYREYRLFTAFSTFVFSINSGW